MNPAPLFSRSTFRFSCLALAAASLCAPLHAQQAHDEEEESADEATLQTVAVTSARAQGLAPQTVEAGTFRGASIMEVPSTVNVITREALEQQAVEGLYEAVRNTAGVTRQQNAGDTYDQIVIRGMEVQNRTNYRLNGAMPIMNFSQVPMEDKERVEVLKGASALYYGFTSPAGVVNYVTKRAGKAPVTSLGLRVNNFGSAVASVDVGRRFGAQEQFGLRVNAAGGALGSHLSGVRMGRRAFFSAAFDWRASSRLLLKADFEYDKRRVTEQAAVARPAAVNGRIPLPRPVDPTRLVGPAWSDFEATTINALLRADYALNDNWALTVEAGHSEMERDRRLPTFRFASAADVATGRGLVRGTTQNHQVDSDMARAELFGSFKTGLVEHGLTLGLSHTRKEQKPIFHRPYTTGPAQNLYDPVPLTQVTHGAMPAKPNTARLQTRDQGLYVVDRMQFGPQWQLIAGLRHSRYHSTQAANLYNARKTTPMLAVVYKLREDLSFYASYAQGLEEGEAAPIGTVNERERLAPGVSKQKEIGARWQASWGTLLSAAVFDIERPGYYTNASNVYTADGRQLYTGLELSAQGQITRQLGWQTAWQWLNPRFADINAAYNGKLPENASKKTASLFLTYAFDGTLQGLSLNAGAYYTGRRPMDDLNQGWLGGNTLYTLGARYRHQMGGNAYTWQLNVDNAANKRYWAAGGNRLSAGLPRTVKLALKVDF